VVAHAGWERDPDRPERAEVAFAIADAMQHNGLGTILLSQLSGAAEQARIAVLSAEVLPQNHRMLHVFRDCGFPLTTRTLPGAVLVELATSRSSATPDAVQPSQVRAADKTVRGRRRCLSACDRSRPLATDRATGNQAHSEMTCRTVPVPAA
jgi:N-acetylglutamate synthase-like GNAT family acetyltransferase